MEFVNVSYFSPDNFEEIYTFLRTVPGII